MDGLVVGLGEVVFVPPEPLPCCAETSPATLRVCARSVAVSGR